MNFDITQMSVRDVHPMDSQKAIPSALLKPTPSHCCHKVRTLSYNSIVNNEMVTFISIPLNSEISFSNVQFQFFLQYVFEPGCTDGMISQELTIVQ